MTIRKPLSSLKLEQYIEEVEPLRVGFDLLKDHVIITDEHANIIYANKAVKQRTGFPVDEVIGKNPGNVWGGHMPKDFYKRMWHTIKEEKKLFHGEVQNVRKNGTEYWQEVLISPILDQEGNVRFFIGIEPDITDRKKKEQFREEFISIIGHQLKNPLTAINWTLELLLDRSSLAEKEHKNLKEVYGHSKGLISLVQDLLILSRVEKGKSSNELVDLIEEIDNIVKLTKNRFPTIFFAWEKGEGSFLIQTNKPLAQQVFANIIANAAEYSNKDSGEVIINFIKKDSFYLFSCKDNGVGIPEEDQQKIFERFFRASNVKQAKEAGTGLGLFIVKMIADNFGWEVWFESKSGEGATFFVKIPTK